MCFAHNQSDLVLISFMRAESLVFSNDSSPTCHIPCHMIFIEGPTFNSSFFPYTSLFPYTSGSMEHWCSPFLSSLANSLGLHHSVLDSHTVLSSYHGQSIFMFYCSASTFLSIALPSQSSLRQAPLFTPPSASVFLLKVGLHQALYRHLNK